MVGLDHFNVIAGRQQPGRHFQQLEGGIDANAEVGGKDDANGLGGLGQRGLAGIVEAGSADHHLDAQLLRRGQVRQRAFRTREVDQAVRAGQPGFHVGGDGHAGAAAQEQARVLAQRRRTRQVERARQFHALGVQHLFDQHAAHAAGCACDGDVHGVWLSGMCAMRGN
ncbi:hypothetical protein D3C72_1814690 [compost metagenome]